MSCGAIIKLSTVGEPESLIRPRVCRIMSHFIVKNLRSGGLSVPASHACSLAWILDDGFNNDEEGFVGLNKKMSAIVCRRVLVENHQTVGRLGEVNSLI